MSFLSAYWDLTPIIQGCHGKNGQGNTDGFFTSRRVSKVVKHVEMRMVATTGPILGTKALGVEGVRYRSPTL